MKVDEKYKDQAKSYDSEPIVEMIIIDPVVPIPEHNTKPVTPISSKNSTVTKEQHKEPKYQKTPRYVRLNHFENQIIGDKNKGVMTRRRLANQEVCFVSQIELS